MKASNSELQKKLARHAGRFEAGAVGGPRRVAVSGASGLVGSSVVDFLRACGHKPCRLVRKNSSADGGDIFWSPEVEEIDAAALEGVDAVVHLAGENISQGRWTEERKRKVLESRVAGTGLIARTLAGMTKPPAVLVSASAVGFYGNRKSEKVDEDSEHGEGFLAEVCRGWEKATHPASEAGIRVVNLRIGMVVTSKGGALAKMLPPFRMGLGGPVGDGRQFMSWIGLDDLVGAVCQAIFSKGLSGPVNAVAPEPETNREFTRLLGRALGKPALLPVPAAAVKLMFGEMGKALLLEGARVFPGRLIDEGYEFLFPELDQALDAALSGGR